MLILFLQTEAVCHAAGLGNGIFGLFPTDLSQYRYALPIRNRYHRPGSERVFAPIYTSEDLNTTDPNEDITHAVIWAHGMAANADGYFCSGYAAAAAGGGGGSRRSDERCDEM